MCKVRLFIAVSGSAEPGQLKPTRWYQACNLHLQESQAYNSQVAGSVHKKGPLEKQTDCLGPHCNPLGSRGVKV